MAIASPDAPSAGGLIGLYLATAAACQDLGLVADDRVGLALLAEPDPVARLLPSLRRAALDDEVSDPDPRWVLASLALLLHRALAAAPAAPARIGPLAASEVVAAAIEMSRLVPGAEHAAPILARLANS